MRERIELVLALILLPAAVQAAVEEPQFGRIQIPKDVTIRIRCSLHSDGDPAVLLRGGYNLEGWSIARTDEQGAAWTCDASVPHEKSVFEVAAEGQTQLAIGEPLVSTLTAVKQGSVVTFSHCLEGRLGETISIKRNGERSDAPKLRIRNADRSYDKVLSFEYG